MSGALSSEVVAAALRGLVAQGGLGAASTLQGFGPHGFEAPPSKAAGAPPGTGASGGGSSADGMNGPMGAGSLPGSGSPTVLGPPIPAAAPPDDAALRSLLDSGFHERYLLQLSPDLRVAFTIALGSRWMRPWRMCL